MTSQLRCGGCSSLRILSTPIAIAEPAGFRVLPRLATPRGAGRYARLMEQEPKRKHIADHRHHTKPKAKHKGKAKPKHAGKTPAARQPGEKPKPKQAAVGVRDPWADARFVPEREAPGRREEEEEEQENPVIAGIGHIEDAHFAVEAATKGGTNAETLGELSEILDEEAAETFAGHASTAGSLASVLGPALSIGGGIAEVISGREEYRHDHAKGMTTMIGGGAGIGSGVAGIAALGGVGGAAMLSTGLAGGAAGLKIGSYGNDQVKDLGWLKNADGQAEKASDRLADKAEAADHWVAKHTGSATFGKIAGTGAMLLMTPAAGAVATAGAVASPVNKGVLALESAGTTMGKDLANFNRANEYAGTRDSKLDAVDGVGVRDPYTGQVAIAQRGTQAAFRGGQQMADYDDELVDAVETSKILHPERWGKEANELSAFNAVAEQIASRARPKREGKEG